MKPSLLTILNGLFSKVTHFQLHRTVYCLWFLIFDLGTVVVTATRYGMGCTGIESLLGQGIPHPSIPAPRPIQPPVKWVAFLFSACKAALAYRG